jgi:hypothetical protein
MAQSVAYHANDILATRGVREFSVHIVRCQPRQGVKTWHKLERAMLLVFREMFGEVPVRNGTGHKMKERDEFDRYFARSRIRRVIEDFS